jgi:ADP-ribose pyrophosphatase
MSSELTPISCAARDVEILDRTTVWKSFFTVERLHLRHRLFAGGWSEVFQRELFMRPPSAGVLLYDPVLDKVVLVEQFRVGALCDSSASDADSSPWLLELVAGMVDADETAEQNVNREAVEEAGCVITALLPIAEYFNSPGGSNEKISLFCGRVDASGAGGVFGVVDEHEDIRVEVLSMTDACQALQAGRLNNAMAIIALQWLIIHREQVRQQWL